MEFPKPMYEMVIMSHVLLSGTQSILGGTQSILGGT